MGGNSYARRGGESLRSALFGRPVSLYVVVVVGAILRLYRLGAESYWIDEYRSVQYVTGRTPVEVALEVPRFDPHPPTYYVLLDLWTDLVGYGELSVRLLSALFGVASVPLLYAVATELYDRRVGVTSSAVLALSPFHVQFSQTARMYSLLVFATLLSMYWFVRLRSAVTRRTLLGYVVATVLLVYAHAFGLLVVAAQHLYLLVSRLVHLERSPPVDGRRWVGLHAGVLLVSAPWGVAVGRQALALLTASDGGASGLGWIPDPSPARLLVAVGGYVNPTVESGALGLLALVVVTLVALGSRSRVPLDPDRTTLLVCWTGVPLLGLFVLSYLLTPLFVARYTVAALPAVAVVVGKEIRRIAPVELRAVAAGLLVVALLAGLPGYYGSAQYGEWERASAVVGAGADDDDVVLVYQGYATGTVEHYLDRRGVGLPVEDVPTDEARARTRAAAADHDGVWLVLRGGDPTDRARVFDALSAAGYSRGERRAFTGVTVVHFTANGSDQAAATAASARGPGPPGQVRRGGRTEVT